MKKIIFFLLFIAFLPAAKAQNIVYADISKTDVQKMNFEILGKVANNYLIYKEVKNKHRISVYDQNMNLLQDAPITILPKKNALLDVSFFPSGRFVNMVYQYQDGFIVYLMTAKVEPNGQILEAPRVLDTTMISYKADSKIYNTLSSEDGRKIMLFKINRRNRNLYNFSTKLYDNNLEIINEDFFTVPMENENYRLGSYTLTNDGTLAFIKFSRLSSGNISDAVLMEKNSKETSLNNVEIGKNTEIFLDDIKLKIDEKNRRYILTSLYSNSKKGNIDGIYVCAVAKRNGQIVFEKSSVFNDEFRKNAKSGSSLKSVFNDYFINNIVLRDNGSFLVCAESLYTSGGNNWDRWGYWGSPYGMWNPWYGGWGYWSPYRFYSPFFYRSYWWGSGFYGSGSSRYHAGNIILIPFDKNGDKMADENVIVKRQSDTQTDGTISYQVLNEKNSIHFLLNNSGKISTLEDIIIAPNKNLGKGNAIEAKNKNIDFMPRYGKEVGRRELIIPYREKKNISFAKIKIN
jgi:hypothetical protein